MSTARQLPATTAPLVMRRPPYTGAYIVRDAALYLRATTPPPGEPLHCWRRRPEAFIDTSRSVFRWIRQDLASHDLMEVPAREVVINFPDLVRLRMIVLLRSRGLRFE